MQNVLLSRLCCCRAAAFALGLATTLALLGVVSSSAGNAYGQIGDALPLGMPQANWSNLSSLDLFSGYKCCLFSKCAVCMVNHVFHSEGQCMLVKVIAVLLHHSSKTDALLYNALTHLQPALLSIHLYKSLITTVCTCKLTLSSKTVSSCIVLDNIGVAVVAIVMGLNLLEVLPFRLPSLDVDVRTLRVPPILQVSITKNKSPNLPSCLLVVPVCLCI